MVSSTVRNIEPLLDQVFGQLTGLGYEVWMSEKGTLPVHPGLSNEENSVRAARNCDCFLGVITGRWGSGIFASEVREALAQNKPRWFVVSRDVVNAREILKQYRVQARSSAGGGRGERLRDQVKAAIAESLRNAADRVQPQSGPSPEVGWTIPYRRNNVLESLKVVDLYDEIIQAHLPMGKRKGNWVQEFSEDGDVLRYVQSQFGNLESVQKLLATWGAP